MPVLVDYTEAFLEKSWRWLKDPETKALTQTPDFTKEDQLNFFKSLPARSDYWIKGITEDHVLIGAMGLKKITTETAEYWGYIGEREYWGKGIGKFMLEAAVAKGRQLRLNALELYVSSDNLRAKKLYIKSGFQLSAEGETEKYFLML